MGCGSFSKSAWHDYAMRTNLSRASTTGGRGSIYSASSLNPEFDPKNITVRECRDSADHPNSMPLIIGCDVTGSMSPVLRSVIQGLGTLNAELQNRDMNDVAVCYMGIGDCAANDRAPLQVTQFESDIRQAEALQKIWLEQRGGSNESESYILPWYFAANYIKADAIDKGKRGTLITFGDECCPSELTKAQIKKVFGHEIQDDKLTADQLLTAVSRNWDVYHLIIEEGNFYSNRYGIDSRRQSRCEQSWAFMGQNVINVSDYRKLPEIIVSLMAIKCGADVKEVINSWDGTTAVVVDHAVGKMANVSTGSDIIEFD